MDAGWALCRDWHRWVRKKSFPWPVAEGAKALAAATAAECSSKKAAASCYEVKWQNDWAEAAAEEKIYLVDSHCLPLLSVPPVDSSMTESRCLH